MSLTVPYGRRLWPMVSPTVRWSDVGWELVAPYRIVPEGQDITIPEKFHTDLASVPRILWWAIGPHELGGLLPPLVHDWLYQSKGHGGLFNRRDADRIFYRLMRDRNVGWMKAFIGWVGVRVGGGLIWRPEPAVWRDMGWRAFHTSWQVGAGLLIADSPFLVVLTATSLSLLKGLLRFGAERAY